MEITLEATFVEVFVSCGSYRSVLDMCAIVIDRWIFLTRGLLCMYVQSCHRTCFKGFLTHNFMDQCLLLISFHLNIALTEEY